MDKLKRKAKDPGREASKECAVVSTDAERPLKAVRTGPSSNTRRLKGNPVSHRQVHEDEEVKVEHLERTSDVGEGVGVLFMVEDLDAMAYVRQGTKCLDASRFGVLPSHGWASTTVCVGRSQATLYRAW